MSVIIDDDFLEASGLSEKEFLQEISILLYKEGKLTLSKASKLAKMSILQFQHLLAARGIKINYDLEEFSHDKKSLGKLG